MEKTLTMLEAKDYIERPYTDKNNNPQIFASRGFVLGDGIDTIYAEMQGDLAHNHAKTQFELNTAYRVQLQMNMRKYTDAQGKERYVNEVRIMKIG